MTSATDELRRLLDERGVEWSAIHDTCTSWMMPVGNQMRDGFRVLVWYDGTLHIECVMSPTQAIAATMGRGECRAVSMRELHKRPFLNDEQVCSECGCQLAHEFGHVWQNYCPNCGRKVVSEHGS